MHHPGKNASAANRPVVSKIRNVSSCVRRATDPACRPRSPLQLGESATATSGGLPPMIAFRRGAGNAHELEHQGRESRLALVPTSTPL